MKVTYAEDKVRNRRCISNSPYFQIAVNRFQTHLAFQVACFYAERMSSEFPKIKTYSYYHRKLRMNTRKVSGYNCIEGSDYRELPAIFLREIAECKKFYFNSQPRY